MKKIFSVIAGRLFSSRKTSSVKTRGGRLKGEAERIEKYFRAKEDFNKINVR